MTITVSPLGDNLIAEHWSSRCVVTLTPEMTPGDVRRTMIQAFCSIADKTHRRLGILAGAECYTKGAPSMIEVPPVDAEFVFGRPAAGRPGPEERVLVDLPPMRYETRASRKRKVGPVTGSPVPPIMRYHVSTVVLDDVERLVVLAITHFRLIAAGHHASALKAASADYRESIVVTSDGRSGESLWWIGHASTLGVAIPKATRFNARFNSKSELVLTPRKKQVS